MDIVHFLCPCCKPTNDASTSSVVLDPTNTRERSERITCCHPNHWFQKLIALTLMCLLGFGSYFCYDNPGALSDDFKNDMNITLDDFMSLYSWYSWPNVVMCSVGGFLIDSVFGLRLGTCIYALFVVLGQLICAAGAYYNSFNLVIFGRFVFGLGGESLAVAQNNYAVLWFKGDVLNTVFGFQLSVARAGSAVNFQLMDPLYKHVSKYYQGYQCLGITLLIASTSCFFSFFSGLILGFQDKYAERKLNRNQNQSNEQIKLSDLKYFGKSFWLLTLAITFYYSAIFAFIALGKLFFEDRFNLPKESANAVNGLIFFIAMFLAPLLGLVIDKFGKNLTFIFLSLLMTILGHVLLILTRINPVISMCIIGVSYSMIACALWPLIALVIPERMLGSAYGIAQSFQNLGSGVIQLLAGKIVKWYGYSILDAYFIACFVLALVLILILWIQDCSTDGILNMNSVQRKALARSPTPANASIVERERLLDSDYGSVTEDESPNASSQSLTKNNDNEEIVEI